MTQQPTTAGGAFHEGGSARSEGEAGKLLRLFLPHAAVCQEGSKCDKYRMMVMINYSLEGTAYGGDYDGRSVRSGSPPTGYKMRN